MVLCVYVSWWLDGWMNMLVCVCVCVCVCVYLYRWMEDGWVNVCACIYVYKNGWMDGWTWMDMCMCVSLCVYLSVQVNGWICEYVFVSRWMDGCVYVCLLCANRGMDRELHMRAGVHAQLYPSLCDPMDCSLSGFSDHGILQARILEWVVISSSRGSPSPWDEICLLHLLYWQVDSLPLSHLGSPDRQSNTHEWICMYP